MILTTLADPVLPRPRPHQPPTTGWGWGCLLIFGLTWVIPSLCMMVVLLVVFANTWPRYVQLRDSGVLTEGVITNRRVAEGVDESTYYVTYQYHVPQPGGGQRQYVQEESVNYDRYRALTLETRVFIRYVSSDPQVAMLERELDSPMPLLCFSGMAGVFVLIGLGILWWGWRSNQLARRLNKQGRITQATVFERWVETGSDNDPVYCVAYRFELPNPDGSSREIRQAEMNQQAYETLAIGDTAPVLYLPDQPEICRLELPLLSSR